MNYIILFLEGIITFVSPCLLPMIPIYISYFAAGETENKGRALKNSLGFVLGFTAVFVLLGAFAGTLGSFLRQYSIAVNIIGGGIITLLGLNYMGVLRIGFINRSRELSVGEKAPGFFSSIVFGIVFSIGWTPCVSAFLGAALMEATNSQHVVKGILMLLVYSSGLAVPFIASALLLERLKSTFTFIKKNYKIINLISGGLLVVIGILMATGLLGSFLGLLSG